MKCQGWAYERCDREAIGNVYQGYADGHWEVQPVCDTHMLVIASTFDSRVEVPLYVELHAFDSIGPAWARWSEE